MTFWLYVLFSILLKCNFSHINFVHYLVAKVPIHFRIKLMTLGNGFVCSLLNELNSYLTNSFTEAYTPLPSKPYFSISLTAGPDSP